MSAQAGFKPRIFRFRGGRLTHLANEAVLQGKKNPNKNKKQRLWCWSLEHKHIKGLKLEQFKSENNQMLAFAGICLSLWRPKLCSGDFEQIFALFLLS